MSGVRRLMSQVFYTRNNYFLSVKIVFYDLLTKELLHRYFTRLVM